MSSMIKSRKESSDRLPLLIVGGVLLLTIIVLYGLFPHSVGYGNHKRTIWGWLRAFWGYPDWQHGMLVLPIIGFILWHSRSRWVDLPVKGSWWGFPLVVISAFLYWVGFKANVQYFGFISAQLMAFAAVLFLLGWRYVREFMFPILFLAFTWPFIFLEGMISFPLRMIMCEVSSFFLNLIGLDNLRSGSSIMSASNPAEGLGVGDRFALDIEAPCSGLRSLFALLMVSAVFGYFTLKKGWQRLILFGFGIPLAIFGNFVRILLLVLGTLLFGSDFAIGKDGGTSSFHFLAGIAVFVVALGGMVVIATVLRGGISELVVKMRGGKIKTRSVKRGGMVTDAEPSNS